MRKPIFQYAVSALLLLLSFLPDSVSAQGSCALPRTSISSVTTNSASVIATNIRARQHQIQYSSDMGMTWTVMPPFQGFTTALSGLTPNTFYMIRARAICLPGDTSQWTPADTVTNISAFRTLRESNTRCTPPEKIAGEINADKIITLSWSPVPNVTGYIIEFSLDEGMTWTALDNPVPAGTTDIQLNARDAEPGTVVFLRVRSLCGEQRSEPSNFVEVVVPKDDPGGCQSPAQEGVSVINVRSNAATVQWDFRNFNNQQSVILVLKENGNIIRTDTVPFFNQQFRYSNLTSGTRYTVELYSLCFGPTGPIRSEEPSVIDFRTTTTSSNCRAPQGLRIGQITETSANATWNEVSGAVSYIFEYSTDGGNTWFESEQSFTTYSFFSLQPNTRVLTRVKTLCARNTESVYSAVVEFKTDDIDCLAPDGIFVQRVNGTIIRADLSQPFNRRRSVQWTLNLGDAVVAQGTSPSDTNIRITLPDPNATYTLCIKNVCVFEGKTTISDPFCTEVSLSEKCPAPKNITYKIEGGDFGRPFVNITWNNPPQPSQVSYYNVLIRFNNRVRQDRAFGNQYQMNGLINGGVYTVCFTSVCSDPVTGEEFISDSSCITFKYDFTSSCPQVQEVAVRRVTATTASIFWGPVPGASSYQIEYSTDGINWMQEFDFDGSPYEIQGLIPDQLYFARVTARCDETGQFGEPSKPIEFKTRPSEQSCPRVTGLRVSRITGTTARIDWRNPQGNPRPIGYSVELYSFDAGFENPVFERFVQTTRPPMDLTNLRPGTDYAFIFRSVCFNPETNDTTFSDTLIRVFTTEDDPILSCPEPREVRVINITTTTVGIIWAPAPQPGVTYIVRYWKENDTLNITTVEIQNSPLNLTGLEPNTRYIAQVFTVCVGPDGSSVTSPAVQVTFQTREEVINCPTPRNVTTDSVSQTVARVTWLGSNDALSYEVWLQLGGTWTLSATLPAPAGSYKFTNLVANTLYRARIKAICKNNVQSDNSRITEFTTLEVVCPTPTNVRITNLTYNSARANWDAAVGALNYTITYYKDGDLGSIVTFDETNLSANLAPLAPRTKYIVQVRTRCENGRLSNPATIDFTTPDRPVCNVPTGLTATGITTNSANIAWSTVANAQSYEFRYRKVGDANYITAVVAGTSSVLTNLTPNTEYEYCVRTICAPDNSSEFSPCSTFRTVQVCTQPTNVRTTLVNIFDAAITWDAVPGAINYDIRITYNGNTIPQMTITNQLVITGLSPNLAVTVQVRAICGPGNASPFSAPLNFTTQGLPCAVPAGLVTLNVTHNSAVLNWNAAANAVTYDLNITGPGGFNITRNFASAPATITGLTPNTQYTVKIRSNCASSSSEYSSVITFTTTTFVCPSPTNLTVNNISSTSGVAVWSAAGAGNTYEVGFSSDNGANYTTLPPTAQLTATLNSLPANTNILVRVRTICGSDGQSNYVSTNFRTLDAGACATPGNLAVTNITTNQALISWDVVAGAVSYQLSYKDVNASFFTTLNVTTNSRIVTNLTPGTDYVVRVRARCSAGANPFTEWTELRTFTTASESNVCGTPQIIDVVPGRTFADVSWTAVPGNSGYRVAYSANGGLSFINLPWTNNTSLRISNLSPSREYLVRVRARCTNNTQSPFSSAFLFTTTATREMSLNASDNLEMSVYPNPTRGLSTVSFTSTEGEKVVLRLIDMTGKEVYREQLSTREGVNEVSPDWSNLSSGIYHLQLILNGQTRSVKLSKE